MKRSQAFVGAGCLVASVVVTTLFAHVDDPKEKDKQPPYVGPAFRLDVDGAGGIAGGVTFDSDNVQLLSWLPIGEFGPYDEANDCWGYVSPSGREYAIIGLSAATGFVDITQPGNAQVIVAHPGPQSIWRDIKVFQHYAYSVSEGGEGIQVFDMADIDNGVVTHVNTILDGGSAATHNVAINTDSGYLYRCGGSGNGLRIYDLNADPASPAYVTTWSDKYVHDAQIVNFTEGPYAGKEIAFCCAGFNNGGTQTGLTILDVTDKQNIIQFVHYQYPDGAYSHQGWLSADRQYFYLDDELDEQNFGVTTKTHIIDVSNLSSPIQVDTFTSGMNSSDHNLYVRDNLIFEANYSSGLRVFDASDPVSPVQIGFFDTYPPNNNANFSGLWSNFPFFPSGIVIGSDRVSGLFVWQVGPPALTISLPDGAPSLLDPQGDSFVVNITPQGSSVVPGTALLHYDIGDGFVDVPLNDLGNNTYEAVFPALPCAAEVKFYVSAQAESGVIVRNPPSAPGNTFLAIAAIAELVDYQDTMEVDTGWTVGAPGDLATSGIWVRVDPIGTAAQPEDDSPTSLGTVCWITGQGLPGGGLGEADVDGGATTLTSPSLDASQLADPYLVYHRWYSNNTGSEPGTDFMPIHISNDGGQSWTLIENVTENANAWVKKRIRIADFVTPTDEIRLRFVAQDLEPGSLVEAGVDDVRIIEYDCGEEPPVSPDIDGDGTVGPADLAQLLANWGQCPAKGQCAADFDQDGSVGPADLATLLAAWGPVKG